MTLQTQGRPHRLKKAKTICHLACAFYPYSLVIPIRDSVHLLGYLGTTCLPHPYHSQNLPTVIRLDCPRKLHLSYLRKLHCLTLRIRYGSNPYHGSKLTRTKWSDKITIQFSRFLPSSPRTPCLQFQAPKVQCDLLGVHR